MVQPKPNVTRWAPMLVESARNAGIPDNRIPEFVVGAMSLMHTESGGDPDAETDRSRAADVWGLFQMKRKFYGDVVKGPVDQYLNRAAKAVYKLGGNSGGHLPTAIFAFASGPGAVGHWVDTGDATEKYPWVAIHLPYQHRLWTQRAPMYGAWYASWADAGFPVTTAEITRKNGTKERYPVAKNIPISSSTSIAHQYDGVYRWKGKARRYAPAQGQGAVRNQVGLPTRGELQVMFETAMAVPKGAALFWGASGLIIGGTLVYLSKASNRRKLRRTLGV